MCLVANPYGRKQRGRRPPPNLQEKDPHNVPLMKKMRKHHLFIENTQAVPGVDLVLAGDSNLWVPGLVQTCAQRPADRGCLASPRVMLETCGFEICNPADAPTHSRGAALDLVIASPGAVESVFVHSPSCSCANAALCCPLFCSDHYAVEINIAKRPMPSTRIPVEHPLHVRDWEQLIRAQERDVRQWLRRTRAHFSNPSVQHSQKRAELDDLYAELLHSLWHADASLYRRPRSQAQRQPSWWNDVCFSAFLERNAAWRQHKRVGTEGSGEIFRAARSHFHRVVRHAKFAYWTSWLHRVEKLKAISLRVAARVVRRRFHVAMALAFP